MPESTLSLKADDFRSQIGFFLGYGNGALYGETAYTTAQLLSINRCLESAQRRFYFPALPGVGVYEWSFLKPLATASLAENAREVQMPDDYNGIDGQITVTVASDTAMVQWWSASRVPARTRGSGSGCTSSRSRTRTTRSSSPTPSFRTRSTPATPIPTAGRPMRRRFWSRVWRARRRSWTTCRAYTRRRSSAQAAGDGVQRGRVRLAGRLGVGEPVSVAKRLPGHQLQRYSAGVRLNLFPERSAP